MKIYSSIVALVMILASCTQKKATFYIKENHIEYTNAKASEPFDTSFYIYNRGSDTLTIFNHTCTCECTILGLEKDQKINPKDSFLVTLQIKIDSADAGKNKQVQCTFKSNTDSIFNSLEIRYKLK